MAECGEKYEQNLSLVSDITLRTLTYLKQNGLLTTKIQQHSLKIVDLLKEHKSDDLKRNTDMIKQLCY